MIENNPLAVLGLVLIFSAIIGGAYAIWHYAPPRLRGALYLAYGVVWALILAAVAWASRKPKPAPLPTPVAKAPPTPPTTVKAQHELINELSEETDAKMEAIEDDMGSLVLDDHKLDPRLAEHIRGELARDKVKVQDEQD